MENRLAADLHAHVDGAQRDVRAVVDDRERPPVAVKAERSYPDARPGEQASFARVPLTHSGAVAGAQVAHDWR